LVVVLRAIIGGELCKIGINYTIVVEGGQLLLLLWVVDPVLMKGTSLVETRSITTGKLVTRVTPTVTRRSRPSAQ
jgi:hypothetical protein